MSFAAKRTLLGVLEATVGQYVDGISTEKLKLGLWSGKVQLMDLSLKAGALDSLMLPIVVESGRVAKISLSVPW